MLGPWMLSSLLFHQNEELSTQADGTELKMVMDLN